MPRDNPIISIRQFSRAFFKASMYNLDVLDAHIKCVDGVIKTAEQEEYDYILVNRSIISYHIYNIIIPKIVMNMHGGNYEEINKSTEEPTEEQYEKVDLGVFRLYEKLLKIKSQTYLFLLYDMLTKDQIIKRMEDTRGVKFSDYERLMLAQILNRYAEFYNSGTNRFYYFGKKNIIISSEHELAYKLTIEPLLH
jgi:hypothetical protein